MFLGCLPIDFLIEGLNLREGLPDMPVRVLSGNFSEIERVQSAWGCPGFDFIDRRMVDRRSLRFCFLLLERF
jgi:hypothetical protein